MDSPFRFVTTCLAPLLLTSVAYAQPGRPYRLPPVDLKQPIIWGASCQTPEGFCLSFGGQDQDADDGRPHTRILVEGQWKAIHQELRQANPLQPCHKQCRALARKQKNTVARARNVYFQGLPTADRTQLVTTTLLPDQRAVAKGIVLLRSKLKEFVSDGRSPRASHAEFAMKLSRTAEAEAAALALDLSNDLALPAFRRMSALQVTLEKVADSLDAEPPARALSPIVYDPKTKRFILFGGDHLDYLTNDIWVFDPVAMRWDERFPDGAPAPRANHQLTADGNGKITLSGGHTYTSNTDYCGGQYVDLNDGPWTYDGVSNRWQGPGRIWPPGSRVYRAGAFDPATYRAGPTPDAASFAARLAAIPANTWTMTEPPHLPHLNRDWGTAVLDPDRDLILRFSGGHSAHGGTDVLHYHLSTNRWELPAPVEFPLGQLYSNTSYPDGYNFNRRPWVTGHTYQSYGIDPVLKKMIFTGRPRHFYLYDPDVGDWVGREMKPQGMRYNSRFYTLTLCPTPQGLVAWTKDGQLFRFDAENTAWKQLQLRGDALPGSVVDNSTVAYDARRRRLLFARKEYGSMHRYDGRLYELDLATRAVRTLAPRGMDAAGAIPYLCQIRYHAVADLLLVGATLPPDEHGFRRTPAYDCSGNRWISLAIGGADPSGRQGRNVSLGLMYDTNRKLFWAVDTKSNVFVLRLERIAVNRSGSRSGGSSFGIRFP